MSRSIGGNAPDRRRHIFAISRFISRRVGLPALVGVYDRISSSHAPYAQNCKPKKL